MWFNTIKLTDKALKDAFEKAKNQDKKVLIIFKDKGSLTSHECHTIFEKIDESVPFSSIVRAINTLTKNGLIVKTSEMRVGKYGKPNYIWKVA
jgi:predicted transcriptional regulator